MILLECKDELVQITNLAELKREFPSLDLDNYAQELDVILSSLDKLGIDVYIGTYKYFPADHRGVYHAMHNRMYLNRDRLGHPITLMDVLRHEGWHAVQDIMAGSLKNTHMAIVFPEENVPRDVVLRTNIAYASNPRVLPWEREAKWAGETPWMTADALKSATMNYLWEVYPPTPLTREWLVEEGFIQSGN